MKRDQRGDDSTPQRKKQKKPHLITSYDGFLEDGLREGLYRVKITGDCEPVCMIVHFEKGKKCGLSYSYLEKTGRLQDFVVFDKDAIVDVQNMASFPVERTIMSFDDGSRWEGELCFDRSSGQGEEYTVDNELLYKGMQVNYKYEGFGTTYYPDLERGDTRVKEYVGEWKAGLRHGHGTLFDRNGKTVWSGMWCNGEKYDPTTVIQGNPSPLRLFTYLEDLVVDNASLTLPSTLDLSKLERIQTIHMGDGCCINVESFSLVGLRSLLSLHIGKSSFSTSQQTWESKRSHSHLIKESQSKLTIRDNPLLRSIVIEENSFSDYVAFELGRKEQFCLIISRLSLVGDSSNRKGDKERGRGVEFIFILLRLIAGPGQSAAIASC